MNRSVCFLFSIQNALGEQVNTAPGRGEGGMEDSWEGLEEGRGWKEEREGKGGGHQIRVLFTCNHLPFHPPPLHPPPYIQGGQ